MSGLVLSEQLTKRVVDDERFQSQHKMMKAIDEIIQKCGFYEWGKKGTGSKQPYYFQLKDKDVFSLAGLYEQWLDVKEKGTDKLQKLLAPYPSAEIESYKVSKSVNTPSNDSLQLIENR